MSTVATAGSLDDQENAAPETARPFASNASADSRRVSPATSVSAAGETEIVPAVCNTVMVAVPAADAPAEAVIVASPLPTARANPEAFTATTESSLFVQVTVAPEIGRWFWSRTSAVSCTVSSSAERVADAGEIETDVGRGTSGGGGGGGAVELSPQESRRAGASSASAGRSQRTRRGPEGASSGRLSVAMRERPEGHG